MPSAAYRPPCVVCAAASAQAPVGEPAMPASSPGTHASCQQPCVEGVVLRVERRAGLGPRGPFTAIHLHLHTAHGRCLLLLGERFSYLADGLAEAPAGVVVRAYHLRRGTSGSRPPVDLAALDGVTERSAPLAAWNGAAVAARDTGAVAPVALPRFLTDAESLVVLEPDWLVDVTALAGTDYCLRQWLADRLAARPDTLQKLRGTAVHGLFRALCQDGAVSDDDLRAQVARAALDLAYLGASTEALVDAVQPHLERLREWRARFGADLFADATAEPCYESTLLCPELGLRGRVDLAFRRAAPAGPPLVSRVVELKTARYNEQWPDPEFQVRGYYAILAGQRRLAHDFRAQVIYTGGAAVNYRNVPCAPTHIADVLTRRNQAVLALLLGHAPPASGNRCRRSGGRSHCVRLSALLGLDHCHGRDLQDAASGDGDPLDARFYAEQYRLLRLEQQATGRQLAALWRAAAPERVAAGTAIAIEALESVARDEAGRWRYRLLCQNRSELRPGELVLLSDGDPVRGAVSVATLSEVGARVVEVTAMESVAAPRLIDRYDSGEVLDRIIRALDAWLRAPAGTRALLYGARGPELAMPEGCHAGLPGPATAQVPAEVTPSAGAGYPRADDAAGRGMPRISSTRAAQRGAGAHCGRVDAAPDETVPPGAAPAPAGGTGHDQAWAALNRRQAQALDLALRARDYLLVQGPPGTGKTHLIACMTRALVARGERVLLSAWTNQAVDTLLRALLHAGVDQFVRLGSTRSMDPALAPFALVSERAADAPAIDAGALLSRLHEAPVLAGTVSALSDARIGATTLGRDVLILDEAAQLGIAASVGALRLATRFILVGDDQQLPPVVQSEEAARDGLSLSPFALLRPEAQAAGLLVTLAEQYRMHGAIAAWPSEAFYRGALRAHPSVATRRLAIEPAAPDEAGHGIGPIVDPGAPLVVIDAGGAAAREVALAARAVRALIGCGVPAAEIGVVAPFRATVAAVRRLLEEQPRAAACTVDTVDRFQGGQREAMIVCLGLDGIGRRGHAFVDDPRRLNVAVTRARAKLIVIGDLERAMSLPTLAGFLHHCRERGVPLIPAARTAGAAAT